MNKLNSFLDVQNAIKLVKEKKKGFLTNFFPEVDKVNSWLSEGKFSMEIIEDTVFFFRENADFKYLYYCTSSINALRSALIYLKRVVTSEDLLVIDLIGKEKSLEEVINVFEHNGFNKYTVLNRMSRITDASDTKNEFARLKVAKEYQTKQILSLLYTYFDPIAEQIPTERDIINWIKVEHIWIIEEGDEIIGFVIFDLMGLTSYLRYWFVHPDHRNKKIGSLLLNKYFEISLDSKRQLFWVIQTNENAIKRYNHYGFVQEDLYDVIMTNKNIEYETRNN